ncbi:PD-(D/E)XK motif protein [Pseudidiomarina sp. E22-M8]|uniref:PD-(D/E)XK motif protein n=1 Tax=Pseudidiomarina sp. E22-M8 TaxID=3424768 RepID=UPI00403C02B7
MTMTSNFDDLFRDDPWEGIEIASYPRSARRLYQQDDRFWVSRDEQGRRLVFVEEQGTYSSTYGDKVAFVELHHFQLSNGKTRVCCILEEESLNDMFGLVVKDIAYRCSQSKGQKLFESFYKRVAAWGSFLKPARSGIGYKKLIGFLSELYVLKQLFLANLNSENAIDSWGGPEGKNQDFLFNGITVEVKSSLLGERRYVKISSEYQLDNKDGEGYLIHTVLSPSDVGGSTCIKELVQLIESEISESAQATSDFWVKISTNYGSASAKELETRFSIKELNVYCVDEKFPKITPEMLLFQEVSKVKYQIDLTHLIPWGDLNQLKGLIKGG